MFSSALRYYMKSMAAVSPGSDLRWGIGLDRGQWRLGPVARDWRWTLQCRSNLSQGYKDLGWCCRGVVWNLWLIWVWKCWECSCQRRTWGKVTKRGQGWWYLQAPECWIWSHYCYWDMERGAWEVGQHSWQPLPSRQTDTPSIGHKKTGSRELAMRFWKTWG